MPTEIYIIGRQRSGTTVLREALCAEGAFNADEVMHGDLSRPHRFYRYVRDRAAVDPKFAHPEQHPKLYREFVADLFKLSGGKPLAIDIKYFGLNLIPALGDLIGGSPFIPRYIISSNAETIHVVRRNKLRVLISEEIAKETKIWSATSRSTVEKANISVPLDATKIAKNIGRLINEDTIASNAFKAHKNLHKIEYESMFQPSGLFSDELTHIIAKVMKIDTTDKINRVPKTLQINGRSLASMISNFDEIRAALRDTHFEWMCENDVNSKV